MILLPSCSTSIPSQSMGHLLNTSICDIRLPAFSGFICGYEDSEILVTFPAATEGSAIPSADSITSILLQGDDIEVTCKNVEISNAIYLENYNCTRMMLMLTLRFPKEGEYVINNLLICAENNINLAFPLDLHILSCNSQEDVPIETETFMIRQTTDDFFKVTLRNTGISTIAITGLVIPNNIMDVIGCDCYFDVEMTEKTGDLSVVPNEAKTFYYYIEPTKKCGEAICALPMISYTYSGEEGICPAQYQPTIIFSELDWSCFLNDSFSSK